MSDFMDWLLGQGGNTFGGNTFGGQQFGESAPVPPAPVTSEPLPDAVAPASPYGNQKFGGQTFGGETHGGNTFGGNTPQSLAASIGSFLKRPLLTTPGTVPPASDPNDLPPVPGTFPPPAAGDLPDIASMIQGIKNGAPAPAQPGTPPPAAVPPLQSGGTIGAGAGLAPAGSDTGAAQAPDSAAPAAAAPGPPPAPGPAAPSDTPAGRSLLDRIMGSGDASTKDASGLTEAERHASGFDALAKLGFGIMAASMPQSPNQRAATIAQLGSIPASMLKDQAARIGMQAQAQRVQAQQVTLEKVKQTQEYMKSPEFKAAFDKMPPQMQAVAKAAGLSGDIGAIVHMQQMNMPKVSGNMIVDPGNNTVTNTALGTVTPLSGGGAAPAQPAGNAPAPGGAAPAPQQSAAPAWTTGQTSEPQIDQAAAAKMAPQMVTLAKAAIEGRLDPSTLGRNEKTQVAVAAALLQPGFDGTRWAQRRKTATDLAPSGVVGKQITSGNTMLQHAVELRDTANELDNTGSPIINAPINAVGKQIMGSKKANNFDMVADKFARETDNMLSGGHPTVSGTERIRSELNSSMSPTQIQGIIDKYVHLVVPRLQSITTTATNSLGREHTNDLGKMLQNDEGLKAYKDLQSNFVKGSDRDMAGRNAAPAAAPAAAGRPTPAQARAELARRQQGQ